MKCKAKKYSEMLRNQHTHAMTVRKNTPHSWYIFMV